MVFAPKLEGGVAYNAPVQQPSAMEAVAGLFNFGVKTLEEEASRAPKPTQGDKFDAAIQEFMESKGGAFVSWDRKSAREFVFRYPQFANEFKAYTEGTGIFNTPQEVAVDATMEWFKTEEGILAVNKANQLPEEERDAFLAQEVGKVKAQEAEIAKLERNIKELELQGTLDQKRWDAIKPTSKDFVDNTISTILGPIFEQVKNGVTVEIDPATKAQLGIQYDTVDLRNINAVLADTKSYLSSALRRKYFTYFGNDVLPSDEWNKEVFGRLDSMIEIGKQFDSPQEQADVIKSLIDTEMYKKLDENGVAVITRLAQTIPPDVLNKLIPDMAKFTSDFQNVLAEGGSILTTKGIKQKVADTSKTEAEALAEDTIQFFEHGFVPEFFTLFKESAKKSGYSIVDEQSFKTIVGEHTQNIIKLTNENPEFRMEFQDWINSDIQSTIDVVKQNLPSNMELVIQNGKATVRFKEDMTDQLATENEMRIISGLPAYTMEEVIQEQLKGLPEGVSLDTINTKLATLGLLGPVGKEIQESIGVLNTNPEKPTAEPTRGRGEIPRGKGRGRGTVTASSKGGTDIGTALGIDFASMEAEAGLPEGYLNKVAMIESGGNPNAKNPNSSAGGLFQQIDSNAAAYGVADRFDPLQSTQGAVAFAVDNKNYLTRVLGREPTGGELYLAHQQGPAGAAKLLSNPEAKAVDIVGAEAVRLNGGNENMTAGEFANIWISKYNGSRGQTTGQYASTGGSPSLSLDYGAREVPESAQGPSTATIEPLQGTLMTFDSPEVQQIIEKTTSAPEEAIAMAKEILNKPIDPAIKALIEALVRIGERA